MKRVLMHLVAGALAAGLMYPPVRAAEGELFPKSPTTAGATPEPKVVKPTPPEPQAVTPASRPAPAAPIRKQAIPGETARAAANGLLMEVFQKQIAEAKTAAQKSSLAQSLLKTAQEEKDPAALYVLLTRARDAGVEAGDVGATADALDRLDAFFEPTDLKMTADTLGALSKNLRGAPERAALVDVAMSWTQRALAAEAFEQAKGLADLALATARLASNDRLHRSATLLAETVKDTEAISTGYKKALADLAAKPDDPDANLAVGTYVCVRLGDWKRGLGHLAKGSDKALADLARQDLAAKEVAEEQARIGDAWWEGAESAAGAAKKLMLARAGMLYRAAAPGMAGLARAKVEKRLRSMVPEAGIAPVMPSGEKEIAFQLLARVPRDMLPGKDDDLAALQKKTAEVHQWLADNAVISAGGNKAMLNVQLASVSAYDVPTFGKPDPSRAAASKPHRVTLRFVQRFDFRGTACRVSVVVNKSFATPDDPQLVKLKSLEAKPAETLYTVKTTITGMALSFSRPFTVNEKMDRVATGEAPTISVNLQVDYENFDVSPAGGP